MLTGFGLSSTVKIVRLVEIIVVHFETRATNSDVQREMIGKYEREEAVPLLNAAKKIAKDYGVTLDYLAFPYVYLLLLKNLQSSSILRALTSLLP